MAFCRSISGFQLAAMGTPSLECPDRGQHFWPVRGFRGLQSFFFKIDKTQIVIHEADQPDAALDFLEAHSLAEPTWFLSARVRQASDQSSDRGRVRR